MQGNLKPLIEQMVSSFFEEHQFELVDVMYIKEGGHYYLRVLVDKPGKIDLDDCGLISEFLSARLDEADPIKDPYFLEVSSPGAERPLKSLKDFEKSLGQFVFIATYAPIEGTKEFEGTLIDANEEKIVVEMHKKQFEIPQNAISLARLAIL